MTGSRAAAAVALTLLLAGGWELGQGAYIHAKAGLAQYLLRDAWSRSVAGAAPVKPWPWADMWPIARLQVPAHGVDLIVLEGAAGNSLAFGPGHMLGTVLPGEIGNSVIGGHRDTHFRFLKDLRAGDRIFARTRAGKDFRYRVSERRIVDAAHTAVAAGGSESRLVLVTCYPFDTVTTGGTRRFVVVADREAV